MAGKGVEIAADRGDIDRQARHRLAAVEQQQRALRMGDVGGALGVEDRAEHVRDMGEGDDAVLVADHRFGGVEVDPAVARSAGTTSICVTGELPRHDVRMMLERATAGPGCGRPSAGAARRG